MTKTVKYCLYPINDGRCGKTFASLSIRSSRKYCDEHLPTRGKLLRNTNIHVKASDQEMLRDYVRSEYQSTELTRAELNVKININHSLIEKQLNELQAAFSDITQIDLTGYKIKQSELLIATINARVDAIAEREQTVPIEKSDRLLGYITSMNTRIVRLERKLVKANKTIKTLIRQRDNPKP